MLANEGFSIEPLKIIEFCSEKFASELLRIDVKLSLIMPCKISVYVKDEKTYISALRPRYISDFYPELMHAAEQEDELNLGTMRNRAGIADNQQKLNKLKSELEGSIYNVDTSFCSYRRLVLPHVRLSASDLHDGCNGYCPF